MCSRMANSILTEIEAFLAETGMKPYLFGYKACRNGRLVERLRAGVTPEQGKPVLLRPETEKAIRKFMRDERAKRRVAA